MTHAVTDAARGSLAEENELPDVGDVPVSGLRVFGSGLATAAAVMLISEMFMAVVLRMPVLLLVAAPITVAFVLTGGVLVGWVAGRASRRMSQRKASLLFFAAGFVAGGLWGYPIFALLMGAAAQVGGGSDPSPFAALTGALYLASTTGLGGLAGRYFGPWMATRPRLVAMAVASVLIVAVIGVVVLS